MNAEAPLRRILGRIFSVAIILAAVLLAWAVGVDLRNNPRTEDAQVRANVIGVAPQVGGAVKEIHVVDNQAVRRGDLLMELDARPYAAEVELARARLQLTELEIQADEEQIAAAEATLKEREARALYARSYFERLPRLVSKQFITPDKLESAQADAEALEAQVKVARAELDRVRNVLGEVNGRNARREAAAAALRDAELKLSYCRIYAPCDGYVTNLQITPGAYAGAGTQMFSLVDRKIWFVLANFRETDLKRIRPGMPAEIYLMADVRRKLKGIVQGVPKAVYLLDAPSALSPGGQGVLSRVSPTLNFILLAQRYPVRLVIDEPETVSFRMGGSASVIVHTGWGTREGEARLRELQRSSELPFNSPVDE
jgi:membrane fusion protein, multidrug efflux system